MKISVIIPVYQVEPYIEDCLQSVLRQTWAGSLECILVDDCGTDRSMEIARQLMTSTPGRIDFRIVTHKTRRGVSAARNSGLDIATGDYVCFLDSDDELGPDSLECLARPLLQEAYDFTIGDCRIVGTDTPTVPLRLQDSTVLREAEILHAYRLQQWYMMSVNKLYRMDYLRNHQLRFYEGIIHEDELWSFRIACTARSMAVVQHQTYYYKIRMDSITKSAFSPLKSESYCIILREMCLYVRDNHLLYNKDTHNIIQNFRIACLNRVWRESPESFKSFYRQQRKMADYSWWICLKNNHWDKRRQVRDFHLALPSVLAIPYLERMFRYY